MSMLMHYLPHVIFTGLTLLALAAVFADDGRRKRVQPERSRRQHHVCHDDEIRRR